MTAARLAEGGVAVWGRQRRRGPRLLCGERVEQRFDSGVALGDPLKVELVGREVLSQ
jgi:hypothetical protein